MKRIFYGKRDEPLEVVNRRLKEARELQRLLDQQAVPQADPKPTPTFERTEKRPLAA